MGLVEKQVSECERRQNHIGEVDPIFRLSMVSTVCLKPLLFVDNNNICEVLVREHTVVCA